MPLNKHENGLNKQNSLINRNVLKASHGLQKDCFNKLEQKTKCIQIYTENLFKMTTNGLNFENMEIN